MRYRVLYHIVLLALVPYFWAPTLVDAGMAGGVGSALREEMPPAGLLQAQKGLGLKLVGTVVADDPGMSFALIDNRATGKQWVYREGDWVGKALIKKIMRNRVIIDAGRGDEVLTVLYEQASGSQPVPQQDVRSQPAAAGQRHQTFRLDREEVRSSLKDLDQVMQQVRLTPYAVYGRASGIRINNIQPGSIFSKMGLRNGDVITGVNDQAITGPEQAAELFQRLKEGGDVTIKVRKGRGVRMRSRLIQLKIE